MRQFDLGQRIAEKGLLTELARVLQDTAAKFDASLKAGIAAGEKLTTEEYYVRILDLTDEISEAMENIL